MIQDSNQSATGFVTSISQVAILASLFLVPLLVIPFFANFMVTTKLLLLLLLAIGLVGLFIWHILQQQKLEIPRSPLVAVLLLFGGSVLLSSLVATSYPVENLLGLGGAYISAVLIAIFGGLLLKNKPTKDFRLVFNLSVVALAALTLMQTLGFGPSRFVNMIAPFLSLPNTGIFNVAGSPLLASQVFGIALLSGLFSWVKTRKMDMVGIAGVVSSIVGLILCIPLVLPGKEAAPILLPPGVSWTVAIDVMKEPRTALVGLGPENYSVAYTLFRPVWTNGQVWWNTVFGQAFDVPLTLLATTGLVGLISWLLLATKAVSHARKHIAKAPFLSGVIITSFLVQILFPANPVVLMIQAVALAFFLATQTPHKTTTIHLFKVDTQSSTSPLNFVENVRRDSSISSLFPLIVAGIVMVIGFYAVGRAYAASYYFFQSSVALQQNDGAKVYELQQRATLLNPYVSIYRSNYALTNLAIATALSNKTDLTTQEQEQISALIEQSLREARAATVLRPADSQSYLVLAQIYQNLIGSAEGADQWAVSSYVQAINSNPADPLLRIELGGLFYGQEQYSDAALLFQQAAELKPDLPNAYYNLANALIALGQLEQAKLAYQQTLALLPADSQEYILANQELEALEKQIADQQENAASQETDETAETGSATSQQLPSLLNQNVSETDAAVVNQPSTENLDLTTPTPSPEASTQPSGSPSATP